MTVPNPATLQKVVTKDAEVIYWPHWKHYNSGSLEPIVNPAGGILPKPMVEPMSIGIIHVEFWGALSDAAWAEQINSMNSDTWKGFGPGQCWISRILEVIENRNGYDTKKLHYIVRCNKFGWKTGMPWMGYFYDDAGSKKAFKTTDSVPYIGFLDAGGDQTFTPVISDLDIKNELSFTSILGA